MLPRWRALGHWWAQCWRGRPPPAAQCVDLHRLKMKHSWNPNETLLLCVWNGTWAITRGRIDSINSMVGSLRFFCDFANLGIIFTSAMIIHSWIWDSRTKKSAGFEASHMSQISYKSTGKLKLSTVLWLLRIYTCSIQCHTVYINIHQHTNRIPITKVTNLECLLSASKTLGAFANEVAVAKDVMFNKKTYNNCR